MIAEVASKLELLKKYARILRSYRKYALKEIEADDTLRGALERYMELALECVIDIGEMVISAEKLRKPERYREIIEILGEGGILPKEFSRRFAPALGLRNILVHMYEDVNLDRLYNY